MIMKFIFRTVRDFSVKLLNLRNININEYLNVNIIYSTLNNILSLEKLKSFLIVKFVLKKI